jgi:ketosteroid isomerase-like protein
MPPIQKVLDEFVASFNDNNLDRTMEFFADDAEYRPGDGTVHRGLPAIRAAFAPQFAGAFGAMRFDVEDQLVDEPGRKAALRWICRHDVAGRHGRSVSWWLRLLMRLRFRSRAGWHGVDVFHFDERGRIVGKFTYANYDRPQLRADLGVPL